LERVRGEALKPNKGFTIDKDVRVTPTCSTPRRPQFTATEIRVEHCGRSAIVVNDHLICGIVGDGKVIWFTLGCQLSATVPLPIDNSVEQELSLDCDVCRCRLNTGNCVSVRNGRLCQEDTECKQRMDTMSEKVVHFVHRQNPKYL
jgi:hypothetical protein